MAIYNLQGNETLSKEELETEFKRDKARFFQEKNRSSNSFKGSGFSK